MGMSSRNGRLYQAADDAIEAVFGNTSVSKKTTKDQLGELRDKIDILMDSINVDDNDDPENDDADADEEEDE